MSTRKQLISLFFVLSLGLLSPGSHASNLPDSLILYTPNTKISLQPGESVDYAVDVINKTEEVQTMDISVRGIPRKWNYDLKSGAWSVKQVSVLPGEKKSLSLRVSVPYLVNKGSYRFDLVAGEKYSLPLVIIVSEQGTSKSEFTTNQANMEGHSGSTFTFNANLKNLTGDKQLYALMAQAPRGWVVTFKAFAKSVTSVEIEPNSEQNVTIEVKPADQVEAGNYMIPVKATTSATTAELNLEVVITGTYKMELTTPTGLLSTDIVAGEEKRIECVIKNTGTSTLSDIKLTYSAPVNWQVTFDPKVIETILAGKEAPVTATVKADKKAIPGDYVTNLEARTPEASSTASFRVSVKTPLLWGWVGIFIIVAAIGCVYYLFRRYGRR
jgi:uncharacterized membrane protein